MASPIMFDKITENGQTVLVPKPQHFDKDGKPVETGENNPLPTADGDVESRLSKIEDKLDSVIDDDKVNMQLNGSKVEKIDVLKNKNISDTDRHRTDEIDLSEYKSITTLMKSTLDEPLKISVYTDGEYVRFRENDDWKDSYDGYELPDFKHPRWYILNEVIPVLNYPLVNLRFDLHCDSEPSEGSVGIIIMGVKQ